MPAPARVANGLSVNSDPRKPLFYVRYQFQNCRRGRTKPFIQLQIQLLGVPLTNRRTERRVSCLMHKSTRIITLWKSVWWGVSPLRAAKEPSWRMCSSQEHLLHHHQQRRRRQQNPRLMCFLLQVPGNADYNEPNHKSPLSHCLIHSVMRR